MSNSAEKSPEIACVPGAIPAGSRDPHFSLARRLLVEMARQREALRDGYAFRFADDAFDLVAEFVSNERRCCPFMRFEIVVEASPKEILLRMTGPEGTRELIDAEIGPGNCCNTACGCGASAS